MKFGAYVKVDDGMLCDPIQCQGQGHKTSQLEILPFFKLVISSAVCNGS